MAVLSIDGVVRNTAILRDQGLLRRWLKEWPALIGMKPVGEPVFQLYAHWPGGAPSVVQFLEESAIVLHTYPESSYIEVTLHSCAPIPDVEGVTRLLVESLGMEVRYWRYEPGRNWRERALTPYHPEEWPPFLKTPSKTPLGNPR